MSLFFRGGLADQKDVLGVGAQSVFENTEGG
jgi:hypothetical protein